MVLLFEVMDLGFLVEEVSFSLDQENSLPPKISQRFPKRYITQIAFKLVLSILQCKVSLFGAGGNVVVVLCVESFQCTFECFQSLAKAELWRSLHIQVPSLLHSS